MKAQLERALAAAAKAQEFSQTKERVNLVVLLLGVLWNMKFSVGD